MRDHLFHLAIPVWDLGTARQFYVTKLGCKLARTYPDRITLDFFGDQVVCHLSSPEARRAALSLYPRHFGVTFYKREDFDLLHELANLREIDLFEEVSTRFEGTVEAHETFVLRDPFDNLIEFKHYRDPRMAY